MILEPMTISFKAKNMNTTIAMKCLRRPMRLVLALAMFSISLESMAQQDPMYTQYMYNVLSINPGYAGSRDALSAVAIHRSQWVGIEGAPSTQNLTLHSPLRNQALSLGGSFMADQIGPSSQYGGYVDFAARINLFEKGRLALGIKAGFNSLQTNITDLTTINPDPAYNENVDLFSPNIGFGLYYHTDHFFMGYSIPKFLENTLYDGSANSDDLPREQRHHFFIVGGAIPMGSNVIFQPSGFVRAVDAAPVSIDLTANFLISEKLWLGGFYRQSSALGLMAGIQLSPQLRVGYAYDYATTELNQLTGGSHEFMLTYDFVFKKGSLKSPRYF
jgi:type IX secretion system PorP/SprF family membrane protein